MSARLAPSLVVLRREVDREWPERSKASDGWLGDAAHRARRSEHNPDSRGIVHALDITVSSLDVRARRRLLRALVSDARVWYVIHNGRIWSRTRGKGWRRYTGVNPHRDHVHVSIRLEPGAEKSTAKWIAEVAGAPGDHVPAKSKAAVRPRPRGRLVEVKPRDTLAALAGDQWRAAWAHERNADLRGLRRRPEFLRPGDRVWIPAPPPG